MRDDPGRDRIDSDGSSSVRGGGGCRGRAKALIPWLTYTDPELARVGMTSEEARAGDDL